MNKKVGLILIALILSSFLIGFVSADFGTEVNNLMNNIANALQPVSSNLLGGAATGEWLFAKVLLFLILFSLVWTVLETIDFFSTNAWVLTLISFSVSILGIRWMSSSIIQTILLPYNALGVAVTTFLPFIVYFILVEKGLKKQGPSMRRFAWVFFSVIFLGLWASRVTTPTELIWMYPATAAAGLAMAAWDGTIQRFMLRVQIEKAGVRNKQELLAELARKINLANADFAAGIITAAERRTRVKEYQDAVADLHR